MASAPSREGRSFTEQFQQQTKARWLIWHRPPSHGKAQQSGHGRQSSWAGATRCLPLPSPALLTVAWAGEGRLRSTSLGAMPPASDKQLRNSPQGSPKIATPASLSQGKENFFAWAKTKPAKQIPRCIEPRKTWAGSF